MLIKNLTRKDVKRIRFDQRREFRIHNLEFWTKKKDQYGIYYCLFNKNKRYS